MRFPGGRLDREMGDLAGLQPQRNRQASFGVDVFKHEIGPDGRVDPAEQGESAIPEVRQHGIHGPDLRGVTGHTPIDVIFAVVIDSLGNSPKNIC